MLHMEVGYLSLRHWEDIQWFDTKSGMSQTCDFDHITQTYLPQFLASPYLAYAPWIPAGIYVRAAFKPFACDLATWQ
jgi:hypothetical protein